MSNYLDRPTRTLEQLEIDLLSRYYGLQREYRDHVEDTLQIPGFAELALQICTVQRELQHRRARR